MMKEEKGQGKIWLIISATLSLMVSILNVRSSHYFNGAIMFIVFVMICIEVFRKFKSGYIN